MDKSMKYAEHLSRMVQIPTVSHHDDSQTDWSTFEQLHELLKELYPQVHANLSRQVIDKANLLYHWKGTDSKKKPVVLMAHQDVVPEGDWSKWKYPPYSGEIADGMVWGRGTTDCKSTMMAVLDAVEELLSEGFTPDYDVYLAFGQDEEIMSARHGAGKIKDYLVEHGIQPGCVFDEGSSFTKQGQSVTAPVIIGEKGYQDFEIYTEDKGGHASTPGEGTGLGRIARGIAAIEANRMPQRLTPVVINQLKAMAADQEENAAVIFADPEGHFEELKELAKKNKTVDALLRSTTAVTMASGSAQANILPEYASAVINCRPLQGDTVETMQAHFESLMPEDVKVRFLDGGNPPEISSTESRAYSLIQEIGQDLFGEVRIIPMLMCGGTDSRAYASVCDSVYRFCGFLSTEEEPWGPAHAVNEAIPVSSLAYGVQFAKELLKRW